MKNHAKNGKICFKVFWQAQIMKFETGSTLEQDSTKRISQAALFRLPRQELSPDHDYTLQTISEALPVLAASKPQALSPGRPKMRLPGRRQNLRLHKEMAIHKLRKNCH